MIVYTNEFNGIMYELRQIIVRIECTPIFNKITINELIRELELIGWIKVRI